MEGESLCLVCSHSAYSGRFFASERYKQLTVNYPNNHNFKLGSGCDKHLPIKLFVIKEYSENVKSLSS